MTVARALLLALANLLIAAAVFVVPTLWGKPWSIEHYYTRILVEFAIQHPMLLSYARVLEPYGLDFHSDDLEDFSVEAERRQLAQAKDFLEGWRRFERGIVPPRFVLEAVQEEIREFAGVLLSKNVLYTKLEGALETVEGLGPETRDELLRLARDEIDSTVLPAYARLSEVERIQGEMRAILGALGYPTADVIATLRSLGEEERFLYPDSDEGRARILADFQTIIDEVAGKMGAYFGRLPRAPVEVRRVPEFKEEGSAGAYYAAPAFDGSRPGVFFANLRNVREVEKFGMRTLAYHEAIPGHHFQIALSIEMEGVPFFRRIIPFTAFIEGWALYAERLAAEGGFHPTPFDRLGQLKAENFRAVRLVVDTGIHAKRWTREQAIDYMLRNTATPETDAVAEIERYIVTPGQACAYKLGQIRILELRERARTRLGDAFDLREFHDVILGGGAMPLTILERVVDRWLESKLSAGQAG